MYEEKYCVNALKGATLISTMNKEKSFNSGVLVSMP